MAPVVKTMEDHEATPAFLLYSYAKTHALQAAAACARTGEKELAQQLQAWYDAAPEFTGKRMRDKCQKS